MINRHTALQSLVEFSRSLKELRDLLGLLEWDFADSPLVMKRSHFHDVLERYLSGNLSSQDVEDWANLVEGREDRVFGSEDSELLGEIVYELANPRLTEQLSGQRAKEIASLLVNN